MLYNDDCLEIMKNLPDKSVDMVLCDLPYGVTQNKWDNVIPFDKMWTLLNRICKETCAMVFFADGMFCAELMLSNKKMWRYNLIWDKIIPSGFLNANKMPLRSHEEICVFYKKLPTYNPQKILGNKSHSKGNKKDSYTNNNYGKFKFVDNSETLGNMKYPKSILSFSKPHPSISVHPTQKPVELLEYLIKTYSNEGDTILDFTMGSGSTGVACKNINREFIGIEKEEKYFKIAKERIEHEIDNFIE